MLSDQKNNNVLQQTQFLKTTSKNKIIIKILEFISKQMIDVLFLWIFLLWALFMRQARGIHLYLHLSSLSFFTVYPIKSLLNNSFNLYAIRAFEGKFVIVFRDFHYLIQYKYKYTEGNNKQL